MRCRWGTCSATSRHRYRRARAIPGTLKRQRADEFMAGSTAHLLSRRPFMEPSKYDNPEQPLATTLGTTLGGEAIPVEGVRSDDPRRASREPLPGEENLVGKSGPG